MLAPNERPDLAYRWFSTQNGACPRKNTRSAKGRSSPCIQFDVILNPLSFLNSSFGMAIHCECVFQRKQPSIPVQTRHRFRFKVGQQFRRVLPRMCDVNSEADKRKYFSTSEIRPLRPVELLPNKMFLNVRFAKSELTQAIPIRPSHFFKADDRFVVHCGLVM